MYVEQFNSILCAHFENVADEVYEDMEISNDDIPPPALPPKPHDRFVDTHGYIKMTSNDTKNATTATGELEQARQRTNAESFVSPRCPELSASAK